MGTWQSVPERAAKAPRRGFFLIFVVLAILIVARSTASYFLEYEWWKEVGQLETWTTMIFYSFAPILAAAVLVFAVLWTAHARGLKVAGTGLREHPLYARISTLVLLFLSYGIAAAALDTWTAVRFLGAQGSAGDTSWRDPVFGHSLRFYFFDLPFYRDAVQLVLATAIVAMVLHFAASRVWRLRDFARPDASGGMRLDLDAEFFYDALSSRFIRAAVMVVLIAIALNLYLNRYAMLYSEHGFMVGMDWVDENVRLPLQWLAIATCLLTAGFVWMRRWKLLTVLVAVLLVRAVVPMLVGAAYVRPNELSLEKPYIARHIEATRAAFSFDRHMKEVQYPARIEAPITVEKQESIFENVRLWDWRAFHDTVTQIQALRQYYVFSDSDVDRYNVNGQLRQVMVAPREIDIRQLGGDRSSWINTHFIYTHGYGLVMASATRMTTEGQPLLFVQDAPPKVNVQGVQLTRPELYFGETLHEPVFVRTQQPEFNYPSGSENVHTRYEGKAGIASTALARFAAAVTYGDWNIVLTSNLTSDSRMLIRRKIRERLDALAGFLEWDPDPYLVVTEAGKLVWVLDGYTTSASHPYSRRVNVRDFGTTNYIRNSVKATVDAYDGTTTLYVFDPADPIIAAWRSIFPKLFQEAAAMPADIRAHVRYPELIFRAQAEIYRTFHMTDPEAFYNKEDLWDVAKENYGQAGQAQPVQPTFVIATLPGETRPEFLLMTSFTPRGKDNMIGLLAARSDGEHLGELVVLQLSKQALIYGPLQIEARIDSDQNISKDLSLWNQQGSQVLRGQLLVLPVDDTFLYVEPIYLQSAQARMPQLKKVVLAVGNRLIYRDTYEEAIAELAGSQPQAPVAQPPPQQVSQAAPPPAAPLPGGDARLERVRQHLRRYRELASQGRWSEAGRELEALEKAVQ